MRMRFKASMPDPRILIIQIVVVAVLASVFRNLLALFLLVLIVDFLLLLQCGWAVFWKNLLSYAAMLLILFALQEIYIPIISDLFPLFLLLMARLYPAYLAVRVLIEKAPMDELLFSLQKTFLCRFYIAAKKFRKNCLPLQSAKGLAQKENERAARK